MHCTLGCWWAMCNAFGTFNNNYCFVFYKGARDTAVGVPIWRAYGDQGNYWASARLQIRPDVAQDGYRVSSNYWLLEIGDNKYIYRDVGDHSYVGSRYTCSYTIPYLWRKHSRLSRLLIGYWQWLSHLLTCWRLLTKERQVHQVLVMHTFPTNI